MIMGYAPRPLKERFNDKWVPEPNTGCWLWTAYIRSNGYGEIGRGGKYGRNIFAHRASWELHRGPIPDGLNVCHKCDTPACVNPSHLFLGTQKENIQDMISKGRRGYTGMTGMTNHQSKLTEMQVLAIRESPKSHRVLADIYDVSKTLIGIVKRKESWTHL